MQARKPKYVKADNTLIDCEIEHPVFGVIQFTASPDDVEEQGREIFARAAAGEFGPVAEYVPPPPPPPPPPATVNNETNTPSVPME